MVANVLWVDVRVARVFWVVAKVSVWRCFGWMMGLLCGC